MHNSVCLPEVEAYVNFFFSKQKHWNSHEKICGNYFQSRITES